MIPMKPAAAKVGGNQGRMAGRRLAVGFRQIVPGEFPAGVVTDRLRKNVIGQPLIMDARHADDVNPK